MARRQDLARGRGAVALSLPALLLAGIGTARAELCAVSPAPARATNQCLLYPGFMPPSASPCRGCGCRGGPGCRKPDGRCAAWTDRVVPDCRARR